MEEDKRQAASPSHPFHKAAGHSHRVAIAVVQVSEELAAWGRAVIRSRDHSQPPRPPTHHAPPQPPAQIHSQPEPCRSQGFRPRSEPCPGQQPRKHPATLQRWGARDTHMLGKRKKGQQYPPRERTRLLCRQEESNTQKQRLKEKEGRGAHKRTEAPGSKGENRVRPQHPLFYRKP